MKKTPFALLLLAMLVLSGCGTTTVTSTQPGANLNPAMTPLMRNAKMGHSGHAKAKMGG